MSPGFTTATVIVGLLALGNLLGHLKALYTVVKMPDLSRLPDAIEGRWPSLTVVVAACDEEATLEPAMRSLLALDYPGVKVLAVNDRSTDGTGAILDRLAAEFPQLTVLHNTELPEGWLGKVHALHRASGVVDTDFVLYTDADVHFGPGALRRAVAFAEREGLDHLGVMPRMWSESFFLDAAVSAFASGYLTSLNIDALGRDGSDAYAGVGAFGLVRRSTFERGPGFEWLRMEVADDVGLGMLMVREAGGRSRLITSGGLVSVVWYPTVRALVRGLEKNGYFVAGASVARVVVIGTILPALALTTLIAPFWPVLWVQGLGIALWPTLALLATAYKTKVDQPWWASFVSSPFAALLAFIVVRSSILTLRKGGIEWRGTFYRLEDLVAGKRVDL